MGVWAPGRGALAIGTVFGGCAGLAGSTLFTGLQLRELYQPLHTPPYQVCGGCSESAHDQNLEAGEPPGFGGVARLECAEQEEGGGRQPTGDPEEGPCLGGDGHERNIPNQGDGAADQERGEAVESRDPVISQEATFGATRLGWLHTELIHHHDIHKEILVLCHRLHDCR